MGVIKNTMSGFGFDADAAIVKFPIELFMTESDLSLIHSVYEDFISGLTTWKSSVSAIGVNKASSMKVVGKDFEDIAAQIHNLFMINNWGDGLPINPPTKKRVDNILRGTDLAREHVIGKFLPRGGLVTVEAASVALAMAGGRPEYLPVLLAALEAILDPSLKHASWQASSGSQFPVIVVNGPISRQIRLNSGFGLLGSNPQRPAGGSIGRAIRFLQQNVGGAVPGIGTMAIFGPMRTTNVVFAEDDENLPKGWKCFASDRHGFPPTCNAVSVVACSGAMNIMRRGTGKESAEEEVEQSLNRVARYLSQATFHYLAGYEKGTPGILMLSSVLVQQFADLGFGQDQLKRELWSRSRIPQKDIDLCGLTQWLEMDANSVVNKSSRVDPWPITAEPDNISLVVAGGGHPTHNFWFQANSPSVVGRKIKTPGCFDELLGVAERELGCGSDICLI